METNILIAIKNLLENFNNVELKAFSSSSNRMNNMGESLEQYIKDIFSNSLSTMNQTDKNEIYSSCFSYLGNQNNPPDIIIRGGDAIEVKKIESALSGLALNSSYPKEKLYADSPMITKECRDCEDWREKDILYAVGVVKDTTIKSLWFVYGDCYAASRETYERIKNRISEGLSEIPDIEFSDTKELGRVNKIDPLGITYLRIRGMWGIDNPSKVFRYISEEKADTFSMNALILKTKYEKFPSKDRSVLESMQSQSFKIIDVKIKSPNNPAKLLDAKLISYHI